MQRHMALWTVMVMLAVSLVAAENQQLVFKGGKSLEVSSISREGGLVYVSFTDGRMQAYPSDEVDLVASGLAPATPQTAPRPTPAVMSMAAAVNTSENKAGVVISDQDVDHVPPAPPAAEEESPAEDEAAPAALLIANLSKEMVDGRVDLSGQVVNSGGKTVRAVTLEARALNADGEVVGTGSTTIPGELAPKAEIGFTLSFRVEQPAVEIRVRAMAAMAAFDFSEQPAPAADTATE